jgi:hypothetical protein
MSIATVAVEAARYSPTRRRVTVQHEGTFTISLDEESSARPVNRGRHPSKFAD